MSLNVKENLQRILESPPPPPDATSVHAHLLADTHCQLAECIMYDDVQHQVLWTDIYNKRYYKLCCDTASVTVTDLPAMLCSFALCHAGGHVCAWHNGFQLYNLDTNELLGEASVGENVAPTKLPTRLNDGRCDREGRRFICGGYFGENDKVKMKVYRVELHKEGQLSHIPIINDIQVTNSICFSPDGNIMYLADSPTRQIHAYDYNKETGTISNKQLVYTEELGVPDGSCCDAEGFLWNAVWRDGAGPSMVNRINPTTGKIVFTVRMPDATSQVSCCCLGGKDLDILFITTAAVGRNV